MKNPFDGFINKVYPSGSITQLFGENKLLYASLCTGLVGHNGIDLIAPWGTHLYAVKNFECIYKASNPTIGYGYELWFKSGNEIWIYAHMSKTVVNVGDVCPEGTYVGDMGNTGFVVSDINALGYWVKGSNKYAGTHLHISKRYFHWFVEGVDKTWNGEYAGKRYVIENLGNGFNGWLDVKADFDMIGVETITKEKLSEMIKGKDIVEALKIVLKYFKVTR